MTDEQRKKEIARLKVIGGKGGRHTKKRHGKGHFRAIGAAGGRARWSASK